MPAELAARLGRARLPLGLFLLGLYALPLFIPPAAVPLAPPAPDASLLARLFPGVPAWWVVARLCCLAVGAVLAAGAGVFDVGPQGGGASRTAETSDDGELNPRGSGYARHRGTRAVLWLIALLTMLLPLVALHAADLDRRAQLLFIGAIPLPMLATLVMYHGRRQRRLDVATAAGIGLVIALWAVLWIPSAWRSSWAANLVDAPLDMLVRTASPDYNLLTTMVRPAQSAMYLVLQGAGLFEPLGIVPTVTYLEAVNFVWIMVTAAVVGWVARRIVGPAGAAVATAALLFSPLMMMLPMFAGPIYLGPLLGGLLVLLLLAIHERRSVPALVATGAVAGLLGTFPSLVLLGYPGLALALWLASRRPRMPSAAIVIAVATFVAVVLPGLREMLKLGELVDFYQSGIGHWSTMEATFFGQLNPDLAKFQLTAGQPGPFDALLGTLLSPFATPRTGLRLWADGLFDPIGGALAAVAIVAAVRARRAWSWALLALLALSLVGGAVSSYDRASLLRQPALPLAMALLAAVGFEVLRAQLAPASRSAVVTGVACAVVIAAGGWVLVRFVNPTILPRSATGITIAALADSDAAGRALVLLPAGWDPQSSPKFLDDLAAQPIRWLAYDTPSQLLRDGQPAAEIFFWTPGIEERSSVSRAICDRWPRAALFTLYDEAHLSRAYAAAPDGTRWQPSLAADDWSVGGCDTVLETERTRVLAVLVRWRELLEHERAEEGVALLRDQANRSFVQVDLLDALARALLQAGQVEEATIWAERAVRVCGGCLSRPVETLAAAYSARGRDEDVARARRDAREMQRTICRSLLEGHPWRRAGSAVTRQSQASPLPLESRSF